MLTNRLSDLICECIAWRPVNSLSISLVHYENEYVRIKQSTFQKNDCYSDVRLTYAHSLFSIHTTLAAFLRICNVAIIFSRFQIGDKSNTISSYTRILRDSNNSSF